MRKLAVFVAAATAVIMLFSAPASAAVQLNPQEQDLLDRMNGLRAMHGVQPLVIDEALQRNSQDWAQRQADERRLAHQVLVFGQFNFAARGENVAFGPSVPFMFDRLVASPRHVNNMLNPKYTRVGVGVRSTATGGFYSTTGFGG